VLRADVRAGRARVTPAAILLDIEGTTTPVAFVTEVLFPYARTHLRSYLAEHAGQPGHESLIARLRDEHAHDATHPGGDAVPPWSDDASASAYVEWLMDRDRKSTALKELQGRIWEDGFRRRILIGEVFPDVRPALQRWHAQQRGAGIFSSGSVLAQQLLFRHSSAGDLTPFLRWYYDTTIGPKIDPDSYRRIATAINLPADACLFLSDMPRELDAARAAGMQVRLVIRPGNAPVPPSHGFTAIHSLDEITT
jgi:enolase-phosphatase E1